MSKIFIVVKSGGEYSDHWQNNEIASLSKEVCENYIKDEEKKNTEYNRLVELIRDWHTEYQEVKPYPIFDTKLYKEKIKWKQGLKRKDIEQYNLEVRTKFENEVFDPYCEKRDEELTAYLISMNMENPQYYVDKGYLTEIDCSYKIDEIEII